MPRFLSSFFKPFIITCLALFFFLPYAFPPFKGWLDATVYPHLPEWAYWRTSKNELFDENKRMRNQLEQLKLQQRRAELLLEENTRLRRQLKLKAAPGMQLRHAQIIARSPITWQKKFTVELENTDGIRPLQAVLSNGVLIGRVSDIRGRKVDIRTLLHKEIHLSCRIKEAEAMGLLSGPTNEDQQTEADSALLTYYPRDTKLEPGQEIITSGYGESLPAGLKIGTITRSWINESYRLAEVRLHANYRDIDFISILVVEDRI